MDDLHNKSDLLSIGEAAKMCGLSVQALRYYEQQALLLPTYKDQQSGYRYYSIQSLAKLLFIKELRHLDVSIDSLKTVRKQGDIDTIVEQMKKKQEEYQRQQMEIQQKIQELDCLINIVNEGLEQSHENTICERRYPKKWVISTRYPSKCCKEGFIQRYAELIGMIEHDHLHMTGELSAKIYGTMYQIDVEHADMEISVSVAESPKQCSIVKEDPELFAVSTWYVGPYEEITGAYKKILDHMKEMGYPIPSYFMFRYLINNAYLENDDNYITNIMMPIL